MLFGLATKSVIRKSVVCITNRLGAENPGTFFRLPTGREMFLSSPNVHTDSASSSIDIGSTLLGDEAARV